MSKPEGRAGQYGRFHDELIGRRACSTSWLATPAGYHLHFNTRPGIAAAKLADLTEAAGFEHTSRSAEQGDHRWR